MTKIFQHRWPIWQERSNAAIFAPIQPDDLYGDEYRLEEIPALSLGDDLYRVCAIPLLVHDINLDDIVKADDRKIYKETITDSGRYGFRVAINASHVHDGKEPLEFTTVIAELQKKSWNIEYFSHVLVGVDAENVKRSHKLSSQLEKMTKKKLLIAYDTIRL